MTWLLLIAGWLVVAAIVGSFVGKMIDLGDIEDV